MKTQTYLPVEGLSRAEVHQRVLEGLDRAAEIWEAEQDLSEMVREGCRYSGPVRKNSEAPLQEPVIYSQLIRLVTVTERHS